MIRKTKPILLVSLLAIAPLFISHPVYASTEQTVGTTPTPTPSAEPSPTPTPSPTPDVTPTPDPTPEPTDKDIPVSESNPSWLLELEKQFYVSRLAVAPTPPVATPTRYYRQLPITPTPSPTPQLVQKDTQVKGLLSATAYKKPEQKKASQPNIGIVALISITVSLAAIITNYILKPKTTG